MPDLLESQIHKSHTIHECHIVFCARTFKPKNKAKSVLLINIGIKSILLLKQTPHMINLVSRKKGGKKASFRKEGHQDSLYAMYIYIYIYIYIYKDIAFSSVHIHIKVNIYICKIRSKRNGCAAYRK